jgi:hypothetical protein
MITVLGVQLGWMLVVALLALSVLGGLQLLKSLLPKETDSRVWAVVAIGMYFALAALVVFLPDKLVEFLMVGMLSLAIGQLGYESLWQTFVGFVKNALNPPTPPKGQ